MGEHLLHGALSSLHPKAQLALFERGGAGTAPGGFLVADDRGNFGEGRRLETPWWSYPRYQNLMGVLDLGCFVDEELTRDGRNQ